MAVVKADAYGHGLVDVARTALSAGASWLAVALVEEGIRLREAAIQSRILVLSELPPGSEEAALDADLTPTVYTRRSLDRIVAATTPTGQACAVHVKVNTGMNRVGASPPDALSLAREAVERGLRLEGLWTHFAKAEDVGDEFTHRQVEALQETVRYLRIAGLRPDLVHAANTAGTMLWPAAHLDMVRLGIGMYGIPPAADLTALGLVPAMSWHSRVSFVKQLRSGEAVSYGLTHRLVAESTIATVPVGYADGYSRLLSNRGEVLIRGRRFRVAGVVTMDQILVDCGTEPVDVGDEVVLMGRQGSEEITAWEIAEKTATIPNEVVCSIGARVPRVFTGGDGW
jgi:alanine racemase